MRTEMLAILIAPTAFAMSFQPGLAQERSPIAEIREQSVDVGGAVLYTREIGRGQTVIVLHGGPDFDHAYLLPELDDLADSFRLIYYDQRGRGRSAGGVRAEDVSLASDLDDLDAVRQHVGSNAPILLGHSWGAVLALEYALRSPTHISHLVLMNPAPVSARDLSAMRAWYLGKLGSEMDRQREIVATSAYQRGDPDAVTARYRIHFKPALSSPEHYERLMTRMAAAFHSQGATGIVKARAVEEGLMRDTWDRADYDRLPSLAGLRVPTLVITGEDDFIPLEVSEHIAQAIPGAELVNIEECGHFAYLECPADVRQALMDFFRR